jgi:hypothetical protein
VWCFADRDLLFYPGIFAKVFFLHPYTLFKYIQQVFCAMFVFFQYIDLQRHVIAIHGSIVAGYDNILPDVEKYTIVVNGIAGLPVIGALVAFGRNVFE